LLTSPPYDDERGTTCARFLLDAAAFFASHGVRIERVLTDNARNYTLSHAFAAALSKIGARHKRARPFRPQTNGKAERFHSTLLSGWAYARRYDTNQARLDALPVFVAYYNERRPHGSLDGRAHQPRFRSRMHAGRWPDHVGGRIRPGGRVKIVEPWCCEPALTDGPEAPGGINICCLPSRESTRGSRCAYRRLPAAGSWRTSTMEVVHASCAGIDTGKRSLTVCVIRSDPSGEPAKETRTFRTLTRDLLALADWLDERGVTAVAMEATGSSWKPIWETGPVRGRVRSAGMRRSAIAGSPYAAPQSRWPPILAG
jgi:hypothetical protein